MFNSNVNDSALLYHILLIYNLVVCSLEIVFFTLNFVFLKSNELMLLVMLEDSFSFYILFTGKGIL